MSGARPPHTHAMVLPPPMRLLSSNEISGNHADDRESRWSSTRDGRRARMRRRGWRLTSAAVLALVLG